MKHLVKIVIVLLVISWVWRYGREAFDRWVARSTRAVHSAGLTTVPPGYILSFPSGVHFSPVENLERLDAEVVRSAHRSLDISMYAFTDRVLAAEVVDAARRGVEVRIYRDGEQYEQEQERAYRYGSTTDMFRGQPNIHVRVKAPSRWLLMHEKDVCADDSLLRTGSANWSGSGEKWQDNDSDYVTDRRAIERSERHFEFMWRRQSNVVVQ